MPRPMTTYRSGIVAVPVTRSGPCPGCGAHVVERRTLRSTTARQDAEAWRAERGWCRACVRKALRAGAGL